MGVGITFMPRPERAPQQLAVSDVVAARAPAGGDDHVHPALVLAG